jgi:hypothetical protein
MCDGGLARIVNVDGLRRLPLLLLRSGPSCARREDEVVRRTGLGRSSVSLVAAAAAIAMLFGQTAAAGGPRLSGAVPDGASGTRRRPGAVSIRHNPLGHFLGVVPVVGKPRTAAAPNGTPPLTYHGGPVQHTSIVYAIFWVPKGYSMPIGYRSTVTQYFGDVASDSYGTGNVYASTTQYYDLTGPSASKAWVSYDVHSGGSATVHDALPSNGCANYRLTDGATTAVCLTDAQLQKEIVSVVAAHAWPRGLATEFFLFTPPRIGSCFDASGQECYDASIGGFCAYHSNISASPPTLYANQPFAATKGCEYSTPDGPLPNGDDADAVLNVVSHEQNEIITDPLGTGWYDGSGYENGDECAWLPVPTTPNGYGDYDQTIHADRYLLQLEWSNRAGACVARNTYPQPTASFVTSTNPTHGVPVIFDSTVSDSDDNAFTYKWDFGDGGSGTSPRPTHTFAAAGSYKVVLVAFDAHGDQDRVSRTITIA